MRGPENDRGLPAPLFTPEEQTKVQSTINRRFKILQHSHTPYLINHIWVWHKLQNNAVKMQSKAANPATREQIPVYPVL